MGPEGLIAKNRRAARKLRPFSYPTNALPDQTEPRFPAPS